MIKTIEELEALPDGSVIKSRNDWVFVKDSPGWWSFGFESYPAEEIAQDMLPATLLIPATTSRERLEEAVIEFLRPQFVRITREDIDGLAHSIKNV